MQMSEMVEAVMAAGSLEGSRFVGSAAARDRHLVVPEFYFQTHCTVAEGPRSRIFPRWPHFLPPARFARQNSRLGPTGCSKIRVFNYQKKPLYQIRKTFLNQKVFSNQKAFSIKRLNIFFFWFFRNLLNDFIELVLILFKANFLCNLKSTVLNEKVLLCFISFLVCSSCLFIMISIRSLFGASPLLFLNSFLNLLIQITVFSKTL